MLVLLALGVSLSHAVFLFPLPRPPALQLSPLAQLTGIPLVFIFPSWTEQRPHKPWIQLSHKACPRQPGFPLAHLYSCDSKRGRDWQLARLWNSTGSHLTHVGLSVDRLRDCFRYLFLGRGCRTFGVVWSCTGSCCAPRAANVWETWPQRRRISTWGWTTSDGALGTGWAGSLPVSSFLTG